jgi:HSP20 family protein
MSTIIRWNPFREMDEIQRQMSSLLEGNLFRRNPANSEGNVTAPEWTPLVDVIEDEKEYLIKAELPEVQKDGVKVTVENRTLTISGERKAETEDKGRKFHRVERRYGRFERTFGIPEGADAGKVKAEFKDGVLRVHVAKSEKAQPQKIEVTMS